MLLPPRKALAVVVLGMPHRGARPCHDITMAPPRRPPDVRQGVLHPELAVLLMTSP